MAYPLETARRSSSACHNQSGAKNLRGPADSEHDCSRSRAKMSTMTTHEFSMEMPHSAARIWALFQDYDRWADYAPMVHRVDVLWPGDDDHNGRLRRVFYKLPGDQ